MSDSQSDALDVPLEAGGGNGSKESISTENDTEADIEEMESIASYEVPIEEKQVEKVAEPVESKVSTIPNSTKKEQTIESKKDVPASKKDVPASKKDIPASKKDVPASKKDTPASKKDVVASKKEIVPSKKDTIASKKDTVNSKVDTANQQKEPAAEKISNPPKESQSLKPSKPETNEIIKPPTEVSTQPSIDHHYDSDIQKDDIIASLHDAEKSKSDKVSDKQTNSSKKGNKSLPDKSQSKSSYKSSNKDTQSEKKMKDESKITEHASSFVSKASSNGAKSMRSGTGQTAVSSIPKTESYSSQNSKSAESIRSKNSTESSSSKSSGNESNHISTKQTNYAERTVPHTRSISVTSHARAETTPSYRESTISTETEQFSIADTNDVVSVSVSSGLQSIRDIFFDEDDSHKGYLKQQEKDFFDASYWSHNHGDTCEQFSKISQPSFNSHLEAPIVMLPDVDEGTYLKKDADFNAEKRLSDINQINPGKNYCSMIYFLQ